MLKEKIEELSNNRADKNICPRCGGHVGEYHSISRLADVGICDECGREEAMLDFTNRERIKTDFNSYAEEMLSTWAILQEK